jgi:hypothetical protein
MSSASLTEQNFISSNFLQKQQFFEVLNFQINIHLCGLEACTDWNQSNELLQVVKIITYNVIFYLQF